MTNPIKSKSEINVGIDVGKWSLDIYIHEKDIHWQEENTLEGVKPIPGVVAKPTQQIGKKTGSIAL